jgi:hypothetical protein
MIHDPHSFLVLTIAGQDAYLGVNFGPRGATCWSSAG